jgi:uncharacterized membrane protein
MYFAYLRHAWLDAAALGVAVLLLGIYQWWLSRRIRMHPEATVHGVNVNTRREWIRVMLAESDRAILAIQTLRNTTMAATFLASTAVLLILGLLSFGFQAAQHNVLVASSPNQLLGLRLVVLILALFGAFFCFTSALRAFNHLNYQFGMPASEPRIALAEMLMQRGSEYYSYGMRAYYYAIPLVFWLFGPLYLIVAALVLLFVLIRIDVLPESTA